MEHILFLFYSTSFIIFIISIVFIIGIYLKEKSHILKLYLLFRGLLGFFYLLVIFLIYYYVNFSNWIPDPNLHLIMSSLPISIFTIFLQAFYNNLFCPSKTTRTKVFALSYLSALSVYYLLIFSFGISVLVKMQVNLILAFCIHFFNLIFLLSGAIRYKKLILLIENKDIKNLIKWGFAVFMFMIATQMFMVIVKFHDPLKADIKHAFIYPLPIILLDIVAICFSLKYYRSRHVGESVSDIFIKKYYITEREKDVIELLVKGKSNKEIAKSLDISVNTVKTNIYNIFQKTGAKNRFGLITMARLSYN